MQPTFPPLFHLSVLSSIADYVMVWDARGNLIYANRVIDPLSRLSDPAWCGHTDQEVELTRLFAQHRESVLDDGQPRAGEWLHTDHAGGDPMWFEYQLSAADDRDNRTRFVICVARNVTTRKHETRRLQTAEAQVIALFERLVSVQEDERRRIARDLHDQLGQQLTALRMNLEVFRLQSQGDSAALQQLERTQRLADDLDRTIDFLTWQLRPEPLQHLGLAAALDQLVRVWSERFGIKAQFDGIGDHLPRLAGNVEVNLYRIAQEALHNVVKHAEASEVSVLLQVGTAVVTLAIEDDGRGFVDSPHDPVENRLGLVSMRERAKLIGGRLKIDSSPDVGTTILVRIELPLESR